MARGTNTEAATILETDAARKGLSAVKGCPIGASPRVHTRRRSGAEATNPLQGPKSG